MTIWNFLSNGATQHMGIGAIGIDANDSESNFQTVMEEPETTNIDEVVNYYFEIRKHLFSSQPSKPICTNTNTNINTNTMNDVSCKTPPIPIPLPNYR